MDIKRYIITQAVITKQKEIIPIWDERIVFEKTELYGNVITLNGDYMSNHHNLVECIYDLKTKKLDVGVELNYYPDENELEFKKDENVLFQKSNRVLAEAKVLEVVYEEYVIDIRRGKNLDRWCVERFKDVGIERDTLYAIKRWKPFYILDNGIKIKWEHELYHKVDCR